MLPYLRATEHGELCQEDIVKVVVLNGLGFSIYFLSRAAMGGGVGGDEGGR